MNIPALVALAVVLGGASAWAREAIPLETTEKKSWGAIRQESGIVVAVDAFTGKMKVRDLDGKVTAINAKQAKVVAPEGKVLSLADISIGDEVSISVEGRKAVEVMRLHKAVKK